MSSAGKVFEQGILSDMAFQLTYLLTMAYSKGRMRWPISALIVLIGVFSVFFAGCGRQGGAAAGDDGQVILHRPGSPMSGTTSGGVMVQEAPAKPLTSPPEVTAEEEEGYHDLIFYVQDQKQLPDGSQSIHGVGTYKGRQLGLEVVLGPTWKGGAPSKDIPLTIYSGRLTYRSTGPESDAFVQVLDELYGTKLNPKTMAKETQFTGLALEGNPGNLSKGPVKIKTFFENGNDKDYAELFTDVDLAAHRLEVHEKDEEYRPAVVRALEAR